MRALAMSASLRNNSFNGRLVKLACDDLIALGEDVELIDLRDFDLPAYDADIQNTTGIPDKAIALGEKFAKTDAVLISSPEYNFSFPGHFKNTLDWISRIRPMPFMNKPVFLMSASESQMAGNRGLWSLRIPLEACGCQIYANMFSLAQADKAYAADGSLVDEKVRDRLRKTVAGFDEFARKLA